MPRAAPSASCYCNKLLASSGSIDTCNMWSGGCGCASSGSATRQSHRQRTQPQTRQGRAATPSSVLSSTLSFLCFSIVFPLLCSESLHVHHVDVTSLLGVLGVYRHLQHVVGRICKGKTRGWKRPWCRASAAGVAVPHPPAKACVSECGCFPRKHSCSAWSTERQCSASAQAGAAAGNGHRLELQLVDGSATLACLDGHGRGRQLLA